MALAPRNTESTATIAGANDAPIKPIKVKTLSVKLVPGKTTPPDAAAGRRAGSGNNQIGAHRGAGRAAEMPAPAAAPKAPETVVAPVTPRGSVVAKQQVAAVKHDDVAVPSRPTNTRGGWAIQVGAFEDEGEAKGKLSAAKGKVTVWSPRPRPISSARSRAPRRTTAPVSPASIAIRPRAPASS